MYTHVTRDLKLFRARKNIVGVVWLAHLMGSTYTRCCRRRRSGVVHINFIPVFAKSADNVVYKKQPKSTPRNQPNRLGKNQGKSTKKTSTMNLTKLTNPYSSNSAMIVTPR